MKYDCLIIDDEKELADSTCEYLNMFNVKSFACYSVDECNKFFENNDTMENTRFNISNSEITSTYNKAPKINGIDNVNVVYGSPFNPMQDVSVEDEDENLSAYERALKVAKY